MIWQLTSFSVSDLHVPMSMKFYPTDFTFDDNDIDDNYENPNNAFSLIAETSLGMSMFNGSLTLDESYPTTTLLTMLKTLAGSMLFNKLLGEAAFINVFLLG